MVLSSKSSCTLGAPCCAACSGSTTAGRSSTSISIKSTASCAVEGLSATTTATGWPTNPTLPIARACCTGSFKPGAAATQGIGPTLPRMSCPVRTATTPGCCRAASTCRPVRRAWAYGLRKKAACSVPAIGISSTYCPRPWINAGSSRRLIRAPTNLGLIVIYSSLLTILADDSLRPKSVGIMLAHSAVLGDQCGLVQRCLPDDNSVEGVAGPRLRDSQSNNVLEGLLMDVQTDALGEILHDGAAWFRCTSSLIQILQLEAHHG